MNKMRVRTDTGTNAKGVSYFKSGLVNHTLLVHIVELEFQVKINTPFFLHSCGKIIGGLILVIENQLPEGAPNAGCGNNNTATTEIIHWKITEIIEGNNRFFMKTIPICIIHEANNVMKAPLVLRYQDDMLIAFNFLFLRI